MTLTFDHEQYCIECRKRKKSPINIYFCEECYKEFLRGSYTLELNSHASLDLKYIEEEVQKRLDKMYGM